MKNQYIYQNKDIIDAARSVSEELGIELPTVVEAYRLFFESIVDSISTIDLTDYNKDESNIFMSYNIPSICKMYTSDRIIEVVNNRKKLKNESITNK